MPRFAPLVGVSLPALLVVHGRGAGSGDRPGSRPYSPEHAPRGAQNELQNLVDKTLAANEEG